MSTSNAQLVHNFFAPGGYKMGLFATARHIRRLREVEERLATVEAGSKALEMEWSDAFDKLRRILAKISKRAEAVDQADAQANGAAPPAQSELPQVNGPTGRLFTPEQMQAQAAILRRRAGLG